MELPDLRIEPWELPALALDTPLIAPALARVLVGNRYFLFRVVQDERGRDVLIFRAEQSTNRNFFSALHYPVQKLIHTLENTPSRAEEELEKMIGSSARLFIYLDSNLRLLQGKDWQFGVVLYAEEGLWRSQKGHSSWQLKECTINEMVELPPHELVNQILKWKNDPQTDCAFAFEWLLDEHNSRARLIVHLKQGTFDEFENLVKLATWSDANLGGRSASWEVEIIDVWSDDTDIPAGKLEVSLEADDEWIPLSHSWQTIWNCLQGYFDLRLNLKVVEAHNCVGWQEGTRLSVEIPPAVSSHERLEARLQWREWVQTHLPESQWRTLLPNDEAVE